MYINMFFPTLRFEVCLNEHKKELDQKLEHLIKEKAGLGWCNFFCMVMKIACNVVSSSLTCVDRSGSLEERKKTCTEKEKL